MTFSEYVQTEEWQNALAAEKKQRRRNNVYGILNLVAVVLLGVVSIAMELIPDEWYELHSWGRGVILGVTVAVLAAMFALSFFVQRMNMGNLFQPMFFKGQTLLLQEIDLRALYSFGSIDVEVDIGNAAPDWFSSTAAFITFRTVNGEQRLDIGALAAAGIVPQFLGGFLCMTVLAAVEEASGRGERVEFAGMRIAEEPAKKPRRPRRPRTFFYVKKQKYTLLAKRNLRMIEKRKAAL